MQYNKLGNTDIEVSKICLGTMTWGEQNSQEEAHEQLDYTFKETGVNFMDTAEVYAIPPRQETAGLTEAYIGNWFAKNPGAREKIIVATKMVGPGIQWIRNASGLVPENMETALNGSLKRLQTDYIDLYQLHWPQRKTNFFGKMNWDENMQGNKEEIEENIFQILTQFQKLQKSGKVRHLGLSNENPWGVMKFLEIAKKNNLPEIQTVQNAYSLMQRKYEVGTSEISAYEGVGLLAYSPLAGGVLTGKYKNGVLPEKSRYALWGRLRQPQNLNARSLKFVDNMEKIAKKAGISVTELSLAWVNSRTFVHGNIIGATTLEQLKENIGSAEIVLPETVFRQIDNVFSQSPNPATF